MSNFAIENKLNNLIPIIYPIMKDKSGIEAALLYKILPCNEIDSSELVKNAYKVFYDGCIPNSSDTIFNALIPLKDFCVFKLFQLSKVNKCCYPLYNGTFRKDLYGLIYLYLDDIFYGYDELRQLFDEFCNLMYSFSNFMPVPPYFNGSKNTKGKGTWELNKDYPFLYLQNLKDKNSLIYNRQSNLQWLNENMDKYKVKNMYKLEPPYEVMQEYYNDNKKEALAEFVKKAIYLIKKRFED